MATDTELARAEGNRKRKEGIINEHIVISFLRRKHPTETFRIPTTEEDTKLDIDFWLGDIAVSIKCYNPLTNQNFLFELSESDKRGYWQASWYHTGKAHVYVVWHRGMDSVFWIEKEKVRTYVAEHGFDNVKSLTKHIRFEQQSINHSARNTRNGLISIEKLLEDGCALKIGKITPRAAQILENDVRLKP